MAPPSLVLHNGAVIERVVDGLFAFYGVCGSSFGGRPHHRARRRARPPSCPPAPERAVANGDVYRSADALRGGLRRARRRPTARSARTGRSGCGRRRRRGPHSSRSAGHVLDAQPVAMVHDLERRWSGPRPMRFRSGRAERRLRCRGPAERPRLRLRHGLLHARDARTARATGLTSTCANDDGERGRVPADDRPRRQLGRRVRRRACPRRAAAASRATSSGTRSSTPPSAGYETSTLVATALGYPVYERLGYPADRPRSRCGSAAARA